MDKIRLGRTELMVTACSFGALPVQRRGVEDAVKLLRKAYDGGINYFDTANMYTDSEMKLGLALSDVRHKYSHFHQVRREGQGHRYGPYRKQPAYAENGLYRPVPVP